MTRQVLVGVAQYLAAALVLWLVVQFLIWATDLVWPWLDAHIFTGPACGMTEWDLCEGSW